MLKNRWWGLLCLCMTLGLHGCPLEVEQEIGNNGDDAGMGEGGQGGQGGNAEGGEGGQGEGGQGEGGQGEGGQGGAGGVDPQPEGGAGGGEPQRCPEGFDEIDGPDQCDEGQECFALDDGRWCRGPIEPGECPDGYELAEECRPDADCLPVADGLFCVGEPQHGECPDGFEPVDECPADAECVLTNEGQMCARFEGPQGCPEGFEEVDDPDECWQENGAPGDEPNLGECIEVGGRLCRPIREPECPDGFELTDHCDADSPNECFPIDDGLFCRWIGEPQGCPPGFIEVQDPDECFEEGQDPANPDFGRCIEIDGRLCREFNEPVDCPPGFQLTDWCDEDAANQCFPIGDGLFCQWIGEPQGCPQGFEPVMDPDECWWDGEPRDPNDPDGAAPPADPDLGRCIEVDGMLCRPVDDHPECPDGFELTDWCDPDQQGADECFPINDGLFCRWVGEPRCPNGAQPVDEAACVDAAGELRCACFDANGDGQCDLWCPIEPNRECPPGFELTDWCGDANGEPDDQCFPIDDGLFCRWVGEPQGCPDGWDRVDEAECFGADGDFHCECFDNDRDGMCDAWCRPGDVEPACPPGTRQVDQCDPAFGECFETPEGLLCQQFDPNAGCPQGFEPGCDADRGGECVQLDNGDVCQRVDDEPRCPAGFALSDWCDAASPNECFEIGDGLFCQWIGEPQGCPAGFAQVDQCDPAFGECFETAEGLLCQQVDGPNECPDGWAEGCDPNHPGECIDLPNGQACQSMEQGDACPEGFEHADADECDPNQNECIQTADGQWCIWRG